MIPVPPGFVSVSFGPSYKTGFPYHRKLTDDEKKYVELSKLILNTAAADVMCDVVNVRTENRDPASQPRVATPFVVPPGWVPPEEPKPDPEAEEWEKNMKERNERTWGKNGCLTLVAASAESESRKEAATEEDASFLDSQTPDLYTDEAPKIKLGLTEKEKEETLRKFAEVFNNDPDVRKRLDAAFDWQSKKMQELQDERDHGAIELSPFAQKLADHVDICRGVIDLDPFTSQTSTTLQKQSQYTNIEDANRQGDYHDEITPAGSVDAAINAAAFPSRKDHFGVLPEVQESKTTGAGRLLQSIEHPRSTFMNPGSSSMAKQAVSVPLRSDIVINANAFPSRSDASDEEEDSDPELVIVDSHVPVAKPANGKLGGSGTISYMEVHDFATGQIKAVPVPTRLAKAPLVNRATFPSVFQLPNSPPLESRTFDPLEKRAFGPIESIDVHINDWPGPATTGGTQPSVVETAVKVSEAGYMSRQLANKMEKTEADKKAELKDLLLIKNTVVTVPHQTQQAFHTDRDVGYDPMPHQTQQAFYTNRNDVPLDDDDTMPRLASRNDDSLRDLRNSSLESAKKTLATLVEMERELQNKLDRVSLRKQSFMKLVENMENDV